MLSTDYVLVGAGVTGIALATRLSENPTITVTVLEAGGNNFHDNDLDTPGMSLTFLCHILSDLLSSKYLE